MGCLCMLLSEDGGIVSTGYGYICFNKKGNFITVSNDPDNKGIDVEYNLLLQSVRNFGCVVKEVVISRHPDLADNNHWNLLNETPNSFDCRKYLLANEIWRQGDLTEPLKWWIGLPGCFPYQRGF